MPGDIEGWEPHPVTWEVAVDYGGIYHDVTVTRDKTNGDVMRFMWGCCEVIMRQEFAEDLLAPGKVATCLLCIAIER